MARAFAPRRRQEGTVLFVCLVLLIALTFITFAAAARARGQIYMVRNLLEQARVFNAADSGASKAVAGGAVGGADDAATYVEDDGTSIEVTVTAAGQTAVVGSGFSLGGDLAAHHFEIQSVAESPNGGRAEVVQGLYVVGPGG